MSSTQSSSQPRPSIKTRVLNHNSHRSLSHLSKREEQRQNRSHLRFKGNRSCTDIQTEIRRSVSHSSSANQTSSEQQRPNRTLLIRATHSRVALSPCLSTPSKINSSISNSTALGGSEKVLKMLHCRPILVIETQSNQVKEIGSPKPEKKSYSLSPSWCSPNIHSAAHKYNVSRSQNQQPNNDVLSVFLNNNGGYLDDSDDEDEDEEDNDDEELRFNSIRATVGFLRRIPSSFQSSIQRSISNSPSLSSASSIHTDSSDSFIDFNDARLNYWERVQKPVVVQSTPFRTGFSPFTFFKK
ncbi:hypothetical protein PGT21_005425 [Puccinia graminis f. sp. tritici]|uniref:Uncharacterized protein n=1 Tax=Puccinia graminis f. sp. tritici TaxID=56615 RepID=A0A5B0N3V3_PUCGR|nr:hypothetical protein PGTUg99_035675 [Puccinia graminis f. sp. tritici]KAA1093985.1 hypothetical protein PGT21_005425 [Puccinia graminis f. sp. tritici]